MCTVHWFDTFIYYSMITIVVLVKTSVTSPNYQFSFVMRTIKILSLSNFEIYNMVDSQTTQIWTGWVHLYGDFFFSSSKYNTTWSAVGWILSVELGRTDYGFSAEWRVAAASNPHAVQGSTVLHFLCALHWHLKIT